MFEARVTERVPQVLADAQGRVSGADIRHRHRRRQKAADVESRSRLLHMERRPPHRPPPAATPPDVTAVTTHYNLPLTALLLRKAAGGCQLRS